jgi:hypothetical protein
MTNIFSKARVSNVVAGGTIIFTLYSVVSMAIPSEQLLILASMAGFAGKHLWDSTQA